LPLPAIFLWEITSKLKSSLIVDFAEEWAKISFLSCECFKENIRTSKLGDNLLKMRPEIRQRSWAGERLKEYMKGIMLSIQGHVIGSHRRELF